MDQYEPSGHGRRRRRDSLAYNGTETRGETVVEKVDDEHTKNGTTQYTKFKENIEYTVLMPGGK